MIGGSQIPNSHKLKKIPIYNKPEEFVRDYAQKSRADFVHSTKISGSEKKVSENV